MIVLEDVVLVMLSRSDASVSVSEIPDSLLPARRSTKVLESLGLDGE